MRVKGKLCFQAHHVPVGRPLLLTRRASSQGCLMTQQLDSPMAGMQSEGTHERVSIKDGSHSLFFFFFYNFYFYLFMAVLGLRFCARAFSSCGKRGPLFIAVCGPLTIAASLVAEHRLQTRRLSNCGSRAQSLRGTWDPPRPGHEPASTALAGRFSTTAPPGKPSHSLFIT